MVLKAKIVDDKTYFLCCRSSKVTGRQFIDMMEGRLVLPVVVSDVFFVNKAIEIPEMYLGEFDISYALPISDLRFVDLLQELYPESFSSDSWIGSFCSKTILFSYDGSWEEDSEFITYNKTISVKVLRVDCVRHRKDIEFERLIINKRSCECSYTSRRYTKQGMESKTYTFNRKYRVWVEDSCSIDSSVIGIKR